MKQNNQTERVRDSATQALSERLRAKEKVRPREIESNTVLCAVIVARWSSSEIVPSWSRKPVAVTPCRTVSRKLRIRPSFAVDGTQSLFTLSLSFSNGKVERKLGFFFLK